MDEPAILLLADKNAQGLLLRPSDAAAALERRVRSGYNSSDDCGRFALERPNSGKRINTGDMRLDQFDFPAWETLYETTYYQMRGGCNGIVHEGRYQLADFDKAVARFTRQDRKHTPEQLLRYHYAFLRGGTRPFDKYTNAEPSRRYQRLMERLLAAFHDACDCNEDFDVAVDDGREIAGYRRIVRITDTR